jgi:3',5'-cyclic AMP phosphodiesterase CpdA
VLVLLLAIACGPGPFPPPGEAPAAPAGPRTRLVAIGDSGEPSDEQAAVATSAAAVCRARGCDALLLLGDDVYPRGITAAEASRADAVIRDVYAPLGVPVYLALGNHDYGHGRDASRAEALVAWAGRTPGFELPTRAYSFTAGPDRVVVLDTAWSFYGGAEPQLGWAERALAQPSRWRVLVGHHPLRSDGPHGNAGEYEGLGAVPIAGGESVRALLEPLVCGRADLYLSGHDHSLQVLDACGAALVVSGGGSKATTLVDRGNRPRFAAARTGLAWLELGDHGGIVAIYASDGSLLHESHLSLRPR